MINEDFTKKQRIFAFSLFYTICGRLLHCLWWFTPFVVLTLFVGTTPAFYVHIYCSHVGKLPKIR